MVFTMRMAGGYVLSPTYHFSEMVNDISRQATTIFELHFSDFSVSIINCFGIICPVPFLCTSNMIIFYTF